MTLISPHDRYTQQARWTAGLRRYLFAQPGLEQAKRVLEVGCGTGAVLTTLPESLQGFQAGLQLTGIDIDYANLMQARSYAPNTSLLQGDGLHLPFAAGSFDIVYCHFLLLWVADAAQAVAEMRRVARPGGWVLALAEPDYGGRVDYPTALAEAGHLQAEVLRDQGAEPQMGRRLLALWRQAGLEQVHAGVLGGEWGYESRDEWQSELEMLRQDLEDRLTEPEFDRLYQIEAGARQSGARILFVPTFYAVGKKPSRLNF